jgi:catechol 2,3-dioxygenase-like lactoylglutathione lyase family enzyme
MASTVSLTRGVSRSAQQVADQDRSTALFARLGFSVWMDAELQPGFRWIEMTLPDGGASIALVTTGPELPTGIDTGIRLATDDARVAHETVTAAGLDAGDLLDWPGVPLMFSFVDPDGNRFYVSETSARRR